MELNYTTEQIEEIINWTLPGLTMYYRDSQLEQEIIDKYIVGDIFRSQTFVDVSNFAGKLTKNCRFIFASSKAAPLYEINPETEKWKLHTINVNSYFKILDVYKINNKTQFFLLHIPAQGIDFFKMTVLSLGDDNIEKQIIDKARKSFEDKMKMNPVKELEEPEWIERTGFPIGLDNSNKFFSLYPENELFAQVLPLYNAIRKITGDSNINIPIIKKENNLKSNSSFWKKLFKN